MASFASVATKSPPSADRDPGSLTRLLQIGLLLSILGVGLSLSLSWLHFQLDGSDGSYTSFCNVNDSVNCDQVLSSSFAKLFGIPVANLGLLAYLAFTSVLIAALRSEGSRRFRLVHSAGLGAAGAVVFSGYMAVVSLFVLETICLMCSGLYVVALGLLVVTAMADRRAMKAGDGQASLREYLGVAVSTVAVAAAAAWISSASSGNASMTVDEIRSDRADFYDWYTNLPVNRVSTPAGRGNTSGPADAPVTIVEFFDFQCGHCRMNHARLKELLQRREGEVRIVYRHFPLDPACNEIIPEPIHPRACRAAEAAEFAGMQGKFVEMADAMFARQSQLFESNLPRIAETAGLDLAEFEACMSDRRTLNDVVSDCRAGERLDLRSTPTMFFNGRRVEGAINQEGGYDFAVTMEASKVQP